jgi:hypothetical protein
LLQCQPVFLPLTASSNSFRLLTAWAHVTAVRLVPVSGKYSSIDMAAMVPAWDNRTTNRVYKQLISVSSKGFCRWCITPGVTECFDFVHLQVFKIIQYFGNLGCPVTEVRSY